MRGEERLGQQTLVQVQADDVTSSKEANHHTQSAEAELADGEVTRPPRAHAQEEQEVKGREARGQSDAWEKETNMEFVLIGQTRTSIAQEMINSQKVMLVLTLSLEQSTNSAHLN